MGFRESIRHDLQRLAELSGNSTEKYGFFAIFSPRFAPVLLIRLSHLCYESRLFFFAKAFSLINFVIFGIEVPIRIKIGSGLVLPHTQGTVLGASEIGRNVTIFHQVTLGASSADFEYKSDTRPIVGDEVVICCGAKILGPVMIGRSSIIGANAVVLCDVSEGATAVGVPYKPPKAELQSPFLKESV